MSEGQRRGLAFVLLILMSAFAVLLPAHDFLLGSSSSPGEEPETSADKAVSYAFWVGLPVLGWILFARRRYLLAASAAAPPLLWVLVALVFVTGSLA